MPDPIDGAPLRVEVVYAEPQRQFACQLTLPPGASVADALAAAAAEPGFTRFNADYSAVGVYGQICAPTRTLEDGDRVEIYRELELDAKTARKRRAQEQRTKS